MRVKKTSLEQATSRLQELDALRGLAAVAVLVFHYTSRYDNLYGHPTLVADFWLGEYGVQLFFMISGFVIFMSLERVRSPLDFIVARVSRLYPVYWAAVTLTFAVTALAGLPQLESSWWEALINLTMVQRLVGVSHVDEVYWTLTVELAFYALMWLALVARQLQNIVRWGGAWLVLMLAYALAGELFGVTLPGAVGNFLLLEHGHLFFAGILFYQLYKGQASRFALPLLGACLVVQFVIGSFVSGLIVALFFVLFFLLLKGWLNMLVVPPLLFLGSVSYSLYLLHQNIGYVIMRELYGLEGVLPAWFILGVPSALSLGLAALFTFCIERPALRIVRERYRKGTGLASLLRIFRFRRA